MGSRVITGACVIRRSQWPVPLPADWAVRVAGVLTLSDAKIGSQPRGEQRHISAPLMVPVSQFRARQSVRAGVSGGDTMVSPSAHVRQDVTRGNGAFKTGWGSEIILRLCHK